MTGMRGLAFGSKRLFLWMVTVAVVLGACSETGGRALDPNDTIPVPAGAPAVVFLRAAAGPEGIQEVQAIVDTLDAETVIFVGQEETLVEFVEFFQDDPDLLTSITTADMPPSFRIWPFEALDGETREVLRDNRHVREVVELPTIAELRSTWRQATDPRNQLSIVYLKPKTDNTGKAEVAAILSEIPGVYFVDQDQTLAEFKFFFDGDPESEVDLDSLEADIMPPSWRVDLGGDPLPNEIRRELESNRHVRTVVDAR